MYVRRGDEMTTYTSEALASMLTSAQHIGFARSQECMLNLIVALDPYTQILFAQIYIPAEQRVTLENLIFDSIQAS